MELLEEVAEGYGGFTAIRTRVMPESCAVACARTWHVPVVSAPVMVCPEHAGTLWRGNGPYTSP